MYFTSTKEKKKNKRVVGNELLQAEEGSVGKNVLLLVFKEFTQESTASNTRKSDETITVLT